MRVHPRRSEPRAADDRRTPESASLRPQRRPPQVLDRCQDRDRARWSSLSASRSSARPSYRRQIRVGRCAACADGLDASRGSGVATVRRVAGKTRNVVELESFLAQFIGPHLRAAGFRKSAHTFRRRENNGDEAVMQFRAWPMGGLCSFLFDVWVALEPVWDFHHFNRDRPSAYPARTQSYDAAVGSQPSPPTPDDPWPVWNGPWCFEDSASRYQTGHLMEEFLLQHVLPDVRIMLDRPALTDALRLKYPLFSRALYGHHYRVLLVDHGPSDELDAVLLGLDPQAPNDAKFAAWAAARLLDGPTWAEILRQNGDSDSRPSPLD